MVVIFNPFDPDGTADWITPAEAARLRGVTRQAIASLVDRGRLTVFVLAGRKLVRRSEVTGFIRLRAGRKRKQR